MYNNHSDFNDENNLYHYSYRDSSQQPPQEPVQDLKPHKEKKPAPRWAKITAIVLAGAIVSGACGYGGAMLANHASYGSTTITQSSRCPFSFAPQTLLQGQSLQTWVALR